MDRIEELRNKYYDAISLLQDEEDIKNALPQPEYESFFPLINGIIDMLTKELEDTQIMDQTDEEMKEYIEEEIRVIKLKLDLCNNLLHKAQEDVKTEEESQQTPKKNIIFATTKSGNVCIENDLKDIPEEYYQDIEDSLIQLQEGFKEENAEKGKQLKSTNKLVGIHEIIHFKVRVIYRILANDTVYVLMGKMKKSTWDARDRKEIIDRASSRNKQYEQLKVLIKDPIEKERLIQEHNEILERMLGHIKYNKRG